MASTTQLGIALISALLAIGQWYSMQPWIHVTSGSLIHSIPMLTLEGLMQGFIDSDATAAVTAKKLDGLNDKSVLVTGTTKGLGRGIAVRLVALGSQLISASRNHPDDFVDELLHDAAGVAAAEGRVFDIGAARAKVSLVDLDLGDLESVESAARSLQGKTLDVVILNAGVSPAGTELTKHGFELAFGVNFIGNADFTHRLIELGILGKSRGGGGLIEKMLGTAISDNWNPPRIVFVASESHRSVVPLNASGILDGVPRDFGVSEGMVAYGQSKLCMMTFANELARRLEGRVVVETICPGPVKSNIAHRAPWWARPFAALYMAPFPAPLHAAIPVLARAAATTSKEKLGYAAHYLMAREVPARADARDPEMGRIVYDAALSLIAKARELK